MDYLTACAIYKDEAPYLREWIEFHRLVGVERFFLYNNLSADDHRAVLDPYVDEGTVVLKDWPETPGQASAYRDCLDLHRKEARWIAFIDIDEFLFSPTFRPLPEVLREYEQWPGVSVNWAVFGPSGHQTRPEGLVLENYKLRVPDSHPFNRMCKCVVDPTRAIQIGANLSVHSFDFTEGFAVDENFELRNQMPGRGQTETLSFARLRVNHYYMKSREQWIAKGDTPKADTGQRRGYKPEGYERMAELFSSVPDETIQHYVPALKAALAARAEESLIP
jgi:hypothetical protein